MPPQTLDSVLDSLFPDNKTDGMIIGREEIEWSEDLAISSKETHRMMKGRMVKNIAPGLDGIKAIVWRKAPKCLVASVSQCFNACLKESIFPIEWKRSRLVLLPKGPETVTK